jgi:hypothetical protein
MERQEQSKKESSRRRAHLVCSCRSYILWVGLGFKEPQGAAHRQPRKTAMGTQLTIDEVILAFPRSDLRWGVVLVAQCFFRKTSANVPNVQQGTRLSCIEMLRMLLFAS